MTIRSVLCKVKIFVQVYMYKDLVFIKIDFSFIPDIASLESKSLKDSISIVKIGSAEFKCTYFAFYLSPKQLLST